LFTDERPLAVRIANYLAVEKFVKEEIVDFHLQGLNAQPVFVAYALITFASDHSVGFGRSLRDLDYTHSSKINVFLNNIEENLNNYNPETAGATSTPVEVLIPGYNMRNIMTVFAAI
jgi:hypothetical protein